MGGGQKGTNREWLFCCLFQIRVLKRVSQRTKTVKCRVTAATLLEYLALCVSPALLFDSYQGQHKYKTEVEAHLQLLQRIACLCCGRETSIKYKYFIQIFKSGRTERLTTSDKVTKCCYLGLRLGQQGQIANRLALTESLSFCVSIADVLEPTSSSWMCLFCYLYVR